MPKIKRAGDIMMRQLTVTADEMRRYQQDRAILAVTETVCRLMEEQGVSRSELARRLGKSKSYVTQLLDGEANMTVRTISDVFVALERAVHFHGGVLEAAVTGAPCGTPDGRIPFSKRLRKIPQERNTTNRRQRQDRLKMLKAGSAIGFRGTSIASSG